MRRALATVGAVGLVLLTITASAPAGVVSTPSPLPMTGHELPGMRAWDAAARQVMARQGIPGATLIVAYRGRVVLERGYGYSNVAAKTLTRPDDAFRLASLTKALTDAAISRLIGQHRLSLNERPFRTLLRSLRGPHGERPADSRIYRITIRELIEHTAGWDISRIGFDPTLDPYAVQAGLGIHTTPTCEQTIEFMLGRRLDNTPGTHYAYSNLGYCVLGEVIAKTMHTSYGHALQELVFGPLGMTHTGMSLRPLTAKRPHEVTYYGQPPDDVGTGDPYTLPLLATFGAAGAVSTAPDLIRFVVITSGQAAGSRPWYDASRGDSEQPVPDPPGASVHFEIDGSLPGTTTSYGEYNRVAFVFLGNSRNPELKPDDAPLVDLATHQRTWPSGDLLPSHGTSTRRVLKLGSAAPCSRAPAATSASR